MGISSNTSMGDGLPNTGSGGASTSLSGVCGGSGYIEIIELHAVYDTDARMATVLVV